MASRIKRVRDRGAARPEAAAAEICGRIERLTELAHDNGLSFLAYLLSMSAEEARRIASRVPGQEGNG